ncbi:Dihydrofolate reductase [[Actinomadura] parvosata subsp. kistnae]|uniref:Deaminase n=1 Tax=[Actinomadura] parvosata subsp. kistnae TaxID=1909395 RepID=A0A1V0ADP2_9ACTN|nr:dihydrofolate reductase family protein [Nonomuraea sp. ATCC 55076]AQZ68317.1 deaminase [Nonomuraea sp. ATCC 55076]SPL93258.1 Dihydrofolate reductase [Actinomadura parvosata subsp. kistnae]
MTATYTFDIFSTLDGYANHKGDWGGYWGKQGPEFLAHRAAAYSEPLRMVLGSKTYTSNAPFLAPGFDRSLFDEWITHMFDSPVTVLSNRLTEPLAWPGTTIEPGDPVEAVRRLKAESDVPLRSHGSLMLNRALLNAGLVDIIEVTVFPVISGATGVDRIFDGADDFDLELIEARTFDTNTQVLTYRPTRHG